MVASRSGAAPYPSVVAIVPIAPSLRGNGLAMRAARLVQGLARDHDVDVVVVPAAGVLDASLALPPSPRPGPGDTTRRGHIRTHVLRLPDAGRWHELARAELADPRWRQRLRRVLPLPDALPVLPPPLADDVQRLLELSDAPHPTQVWCMRFTVTAVARELAQRWRVPFAADLDDDDVGFLERTGAKADADAVRRLLVEDAAPADLVTASGPTVAAAVGAHLGRAVAVVPNGVGIPPDPGPPAHRLPDAPATLLFVANFTYAPNRAGAAWLLEHVLASPRLRHPVCVRLVGPGAADAVAPDAGVAHPHRLVAVGPVPDLVGEYRAADLVVAPVPDGGGTSTKVAEAAAHRRAVVATTAAARDVELHDRRHLRIADTPDDFAAALDGLLGDPATAEVLATAARHAVATAQTDVHVHAMVAGLARQLATGTTGPGGGDAARR